MSERKLFSPMNIGKMTVKNRVVMAPMYMGFGDFDGKPTAKLIDYYEERAKGGVGLIITEITRVNDFHGAAAFGQLAMSHDYHIEPMREFAKKIQQHGTKLVVQIHHPGRQNLGLLIGTVPLMLPFIKIPGFKKLVFKMVPTLQKLMAKDLVPKVYAPSVVERSKFAESKMRALTNHQVKMLVKNFVDAGERCFKAGVDGVELHAAHGYLIQQFLSPVTNKRVDEYGGSLENRMRFLLEIIQGIRERCGDFPILVRLSVDECYSHIGEPEKGYSLEEGIEMVKILENAGIDAIDVSSASYDTFNYWLEPVTFTPGWRAYMANEVKKVVKIPVIAANLIRSPEQAEAQLEKGMQDFVSLGRPLIADPHWVNKVASGKTKDIKRCINCLSCFETMQNNAYIGEHGLCSVNPGLGNEKALMNVKRDGNGRVVVIIGAGVAGLTAARVLGRRGFSPVIIEKEEFAGGQLRLAKQPPNKERIFWCVEDLFHTAKEVGTTFHFNTLATVDFVKSLNPYAVIVATGGVSIRPKSIEGVDLPNVFTTTDILNGEVLLSNKNVAVIGSGMTGLETAELLISQKNQVTVIEMLDCVAKDAWFQHVDDILPKLEKALTAILTGKRLEKITEKDITIEDTKTKKKEVLTFDNVVLSVGVCPVNELYSPLKDAFERVQIIGDAATVGRIINATHSAYEAAMNIK